MTSIKVKNPSKSRTFKEIKQGDCFIFSLANVEDHEPILFMKVDKITTSAYPNDDYNCISLATGRVVHIDSEANIIEHNIDIIAEEV